MLFFYAKDVDESTGSQIKRRTSYGNILSLDAISIGVAPEPAEQSV
jgi:hypothetical protein